MAQYNIQDCCNSNNIMQVDNITGTFLNGDVLFFEATGFTTPGLLSYSFTGCGTVTSSVSITSTLTATTNTTAYTDCYTCDLYNTGATSCDCTCVATSQVTLTSNNYTGQIAQITFSAQTGGTYNLGNQLVPYIYDSCNYLGNYDLYFSAFNKTCSVGFSGFSNCDVFLISEQPGGNPRTLWYYSPENNYTYNLGSIGAPCSYGGVTQEIASTGSKQWFYLCSGGTTTYLRELHWGWYPSSSLWLDYFNYTADTRNITLDFLPTNQLGRSLVAINDRYLALTYVSSVDGSTKVALCDVSGLTANTTVKFTLPSGISDMGDMIYTTQGKVIIPVTDGVNKALYQYDFLSGTFEFSGTTTKDFQGAFANNGINYFIDYSTNDLYSASTTNPYTQTLVQNQIVNIAGFGNIVGASSSPCCATNSFKA